MTDFSRKDFENTSDEVFKKYLLEEINNNNYLTLSDKIKDITKVEDITKEELEDYKTELEYILFGRQEEEYDTLRKRMTEEELNDFFRYEEEIV